MAAEFKLSFTGSEVNDKLGKIDRFVEELQSKVGDTSVSEQITEAIENKSDVGHTHTKSDITDFPIALKNPNTLTINGETYDGSEAVDMTEQINALIDAKLATITNAEEVSF